MKYRPTIIPIILSLIALALYFGFRNINLENKSSENNFHSIKLMSDFELNDIEGNRISISNWKGQDLIINFWATWCAPCLREIPLLKDYQSQNGSAQVVGIAVDRLEPVKNFIQDIGFNYPILIGQSEAIGVAKMLGINVFALPLTFFITKEGVIVETHIGELLPKDLKLGLEKIHYQNNL
jgi:thiol-disulfide isomerase/thioredoxin|tara:strand:- start:24700 stop:25242 length:543 start_codon:yes stop_codon:yes gene_type:complete